MQQDQPINKWVLFFCVLTFGAAIPFLVSGWFVNKDNYNKIPNLDEFGVHRPRAQVYDITNEHSNLLKVVAESYESESKNAKNAYDVRPRYAKLIRDIQSLNMIHVNFIFGNVSLWASIVLLTGLCIAQWVSGSILYYLSRNPSVSLRLAGINISLFIVSLFMAFVPFMRWADYMFYYVLPIPVLVLWGIYGLKYIFNILSEPNENPITNSMYAIWHYCGILLLYNCMWDHHFVPWLF